MRSAIRVGETSAASESPGGKCLSDAFAVAPNLTDPIRTAYSPCATADPLAPSSCMTACVVAGKPRQLPSPFTRVGVVEPPCGHAELLVSSGWHRAKHNRVVFGPSANINTMERTAARGTRCSAMPIAKATPSRSVQVAVEIRGSLRAGLLPTHRLRGFRQLLPKIPPERARGLRRKSRANHLRAVCFKVSETRPIRSLASRATFASSDDAARDAVASRTSGFVNLTIVRCAPRDSIVTCTAAAALPRDRH